MSRGATVVLRIVCSLILVAAVVHWVGSEGFRSTWRSVSPWHWIGAVGAFLVIHAGCALKWRHAITGFGANIPKSDALRAHAAGLAGNFFLPSIVGGDLLRTGMVLRRSGRPEALILGSLTDRLLDAAALGILFSVGTLMRRDDRAGIGVVATIAGAAACLVGFKLAARVPWTRLLPGGLARTGLRMRVAARRVPLATLASGLAASVMLQGALLFVNMRLAAGMGLPDDASAWLLAWSAAKLAAMLPLSFGGLGVREAAWASLADPLGFPRAAAVAQSLVWQSVLFAGGFAAGLWSTASPGRPSRSASP